MIRYTYNKLVRDKIPEDIDNEFKRIQNGTSKKSHGS